jgi:hypothetical protein
VNCQKYQINTSIPSLLHKYRVFARVFRDCFVAAAPQPPPPASRCAELRSCKCSFQPFSTGQHTASSKHCIAKPCTSLRSISAFAAPQASRRCCHAAGLLSRTYLFRVEWTTSLHYLCRCSIFNHHNSQCESYSPFTRCIF